MDILESQNKEYGFYGTAALHGRSKVAAKWKAAFLWVAAAMPSWSPEDIRNFLDGRPGRHLADQLRDCGSMAKIDPAQWLRVMYGFALEVGIADKTPGLDLRLKADAEFRKAEESLRKAAKIYDAILRRFSPNDEDVYVKALRDHALKSINMASLFLGDE